MGPNSLERIIVGARKDRLKRPNSSTRDIRKGMVIGVVLLSELSSAIRSFVGNVIKQIDRVMQQIKEITG